MIETYLAQLQDQKYDATQQWEVLKAQLIDGYKDEHERQAKRKVDEACMDDISPISAVESSNGRSPSEETSGLECVSDVIGTRHLKAMERALVDGGSVAVTKEGRAQPMAHGMACWMRPSDDEVPTTLRVQTWSREAQPVPEDNGCIDDDDYRPMEDVDWELDQLDQDPGRMDHDPENPETPQHSWPPKQLSEEYVSLDLLKAMRSLAARFGEPLLESAACEWEEESADKSVIWSDDDPRPEDNDIMLHFLDAVDYGDLNVADVDGELEFFEELFEAALDSGAGDHVADETSAPMYEVEESPGSRADQHFVTAGGGRLRNRGQLKLGLRADNGRKGRELRMTFQVAKVTKPLLSVSKICDAGFSVRFTQEMAVVEDKKGKEVCRFIRRKGLYVASMRLRNPKFKAKTSDFPRPDPK